MRDNIPRTILERHLQDAKIYMKGFLLNAGCGDRTYEHIYGGVSDRQIRFDWPKTVHDKRSIDVFGSIMELPFSAETFEAILCTEVLEHVPDPQKTLREFYRVMKPGGHAIVSVPLLYQVHEAPYDYFRYTYYGLVHLFHQAGFEIIRAKARGDIIAVVIYFVRKLLYRINAHLFGKRLSNAISLMWMDALYLRWMGEKAFDLDPQNHAYTLGYTVVAKKK